MYLKKIKLLKLNTGEELFPTKEIPKRILAIRLQAMGDTVITLPYLQHLKRSLPEGHILDFLTREEVDSIPRNIQLFDKVYAIRGGRNTQKQLVYAALLLPALIIRSYNIVIDLQNNIVSRYIRHALSPGLWSSFDRFSAKSAGLRTQETIEKIGAGKNFADTNFILKNPLEANEILYRNGWNGHSRLVVLNPAGAFETRHWLIQNYAEFAKLFLEKYPDIMFVLLGTEKLNTAADYLQNKLQGKLISLIRQTNAAQAFAIIQKTMLVLTEDSGLMHFAWVSGIPTLALFGSTRSDWSRPLGEKSMLLDSSDLTCGNCMLEHCTYGDTRCLTRYSPEFVFEKALKLLNK